MPKQTFLKRTDETPPVRNGEFVATSTVLQISQLAMTSPFVGDFQIIGQGRLIVGEHPDLGERFIVTSGGAFAFNAAGTRTFAVWTRGDGVHTGGDVYLGHPDNFLLYDQSEGTLGLYTAAGAGFIADSDGSLFAGDSDGAHMRWSSASRALEIRNGEDVKISLDANGDGLFDGMVYASGGRIYGQMQVDGLFRAGDVDGPSISLGRFERLNESNVLVESSEIVATDAANLPWFRVVAGGSTPGGGWFQVGNPGDYQQRMTYDGTRLALDGDIYARGGEFAGAVEITTGAIYFGGGRGVLNSTGMALQSSTLGNEGYNAVTWRTDLADAATNNLYIYAQEALSQNQVYIEQPATTTAGTGTINVYARGTSSGTINLISLDTGTPEISSLSINSALGVRVTGITALGDGGATNYAQFDADGTFSLAGTARYERHVQIDAIATGAVVNQPTPSDFFTVGGLQYPTTGAKYAFCQWEVPDDWDGGDVYFEINWFPDSGAISGTAAVRWTVEYRAIAEGEAINTGTSVTLDNGAGGDTGDYIQYQTKHTRVTLTYNNANQPLAKQDHVYFKVSRDTGVANDFSGSVTVSAYEIIYTSTGLPTSN